MEIRFSLSAIAVLKKAAQMTDVCKAVQLIGGLLDTPGTIEGLKVVKYNSETGKPEKEEWRPKEWDGTLWIAAGIFHSPSLDREDPLYASLMNALPPGKVMVFGGIVVEHVLSKAEGGWERGGIVPNHIQFRKAVAVSL